MTLAPLAVSADDGRGAAPPAPPASGAASLLSRPTEFVTDIERSEALADQVGAQIKATFLAGLKRGSWEAVADALTPDFVGAFPGPDGGQAVPDRGLAIRRYVSEGLPPLDRAGFVSVLRAQVQAWSHLERANWRTYEFLLDPSEQRAYARIHFQLGGPRPEGGRGYVDTSVEVELVAAAEDAWKLRRLALLEGNRVESPRPPFNDITALTGFSFNESDANRDLSQRVIDDRTILTNGGLSVVDWNRDGFWDVLATVANKQTVLFLNDGKGGFVRAEAPARTPEEAAYFYLYLDLDNDGTEELVSTRVVAIEGTRARLDLRVSRDGAWKTLPGALECAVPAGTRSLNVQSIVPCDVDGNGLIDLFFCAYSNSESKGERYNTVDAHDGAANLLFLNQGGLRFTEEAEARGVRGTQYSYAAAFFDFDGDGDPDLLVANDYGPNVYYENLGKGRFQERPEHLFAQGSNYSMGLTLGDYDNTGAWSVHVSNMSSHAGQRITALAGGMGEAMRARIRAMGAGNQLYEREGKVGAWTERGVERGVNWAEWAWAALFADFDNDGDKDLFVTNGFTSHRDAKAPDY
ncbi:MAG: VCBS repeat-containing protein [Planctomycetes bacterium]|nr:VCBS repeat-containing protein [Planctomycetota bacterium]